MTMDPTDRSARVTLIALLVVALALMAMLLAPFATALYLAAVLAGVLHPAIAPMTRRMHVRTGFAAALLTLAVLVALVLPLGWLGTVFVQQGFRTAAGARDLFAGRTIEESIARLPAALQGAATWARPHIEDALPQIRNALATGLQALAQRVPGWLARTGGFVGEAALMLIALYALLVDGPRLVNWLGSVSPLPRGRFESLLEGFRRIASAVLMSTLLVAAAQSLATFAGLAMVRAPQPVFFAFVAFVIAFIPILSPGLVSFGVAITLLAQGRWVAALVLAVWTIVVVMTVDNLLRPMLLQRGIGLHPAVLLFAVLGGVMAFGPIGIVAGPMVLSFFLAMVELCHREFAPARGAGAAPSTGAAGD